MLRLLLQAIFLIAFVFLIESEPFEGRLVPPASYAKLVEFKVGWMNVLLSSYRESGCVFNTPQGLQVYEMAADDIAIYCGQYAVACYDGWNNMIYIEAGDISALSHEIDHAIWNFSFVPRTCWEHASILQTDLLLQGRYAK